MRRKGRDRYTPARARLVARLMLPDCHRKARILMKTGKLWVLTSPSKEMAGGIWIATVTPNISVFNGVTPQITAMFTETP